MNRVLPSITRTPLSITLRFTFSIISGLLGAEVDCDFFIVENHSVTLNSSAECPEVPPKLVGQLKVVVDIGSEDEIGTTDLEPGGEYIPRCTPR